MTLERDVILCSQTNVAAIQKVISVIIIGPSNWLDSYKFVSTIIKYMLSELRDSMHSPSHFYVAHRIDNHHYHLQEKVPEITFINGKQILTAIL